MSRFSIALWLGVAPLGCGGDASVPADPRDVYPSRVDLGLPCQDTVTSRDINETRTVEGQEGRSTTTASEVDGCRRSYAIASTAPTVVPEVDNPRVFMELEGQPTLRTGNVAFDATYALAHEEVRQLSVGAIEDDAFGNGRAIDCPSGGCFQTGEKWKYVWTRDLAYAVDLGLAAVDPIRALNSLSFKLSRPRGGGALEIVQDTGTGGSYPVSTDRVVWALGARALLEALSAPERASFSALAREALDATLDRDRVLVFDPADGLYRGEQSFLDWRRQSYPEWTENDVGRIATSKALSTNVGHLAAIELARDLAEEAGDPARVEALRGWADALRVAIRDRLWQDDVGLPAAFITTQLDPVPARQYDALGLALAILHGVLSPEEGARALSNYPVLEPGPPVIWPQQRNTDIYHNRAMWPFVTAYWLRAAHRVGHAAAVDHGVRALFRQTALHLSNMENYEMSTGQTAFDDGTRSGPVINSARQLWSVAGYLSMVHDVVFGLEVRDGVLRVQPALPNSLREALFTGSERLVLNRYPFGGKTVTVVLHLPPQSPPGAVMVPAQILVDGAPAPTEIRPQDLGERSVIEVFIASEAVQPRSLTLVSDLSDDRTWMPPRPPRIAFIRAESGGLSLEVWHREEDLRWDVFRDGARVAENLEPGGTWLDAGARSDTAHCYTAEAYYPDTGLRSQRAFPRCSMGPDDSLAITVFAPAFTAVGGRLVREGERDFYEQWGDPEHTLSATVAVTAAGVYRIDVEFANGSGPSNTGVTCGVKRLDVLDGDRVIGGGYLVMASNGTWNAWRRSSYVTAELEAGRTYELRVRHDDVSRNMSSLAHFDTYTANLGGVSGAYHRVNIAHLRLLPEP